MSGIKDKVAIIGMGCTRFGERFDTSREDLILEAIQEALEDAHMELKDIDAFWFGSFYEMHGTSLSSVIKSDFKPVTRIENNCMIRIVETLQKKKLQLTNSGML